MDVGYVAVFLPLFLLLFLPLFLPLFLRVFFEVGCVALGVGDALFNVGFFDVSSCVVQPCVRHLWG